MEEVVSRGQVRGDGEDQAESRGPVEVLFYGPYAMDRAYRTATWWIYAIGKMTLMRRFTHCCLRVGPRQYHCTPGGSSVCWHRAAERVMPCYAKITIKERPSYLLWPRTPPKFDLFRSLLWRWHLLPLQDSATNCVTMTCRLLGLPNIARTPSTLYDRLLERN
jgi:hypothetical protein